MQRLQHAGVRVVLANVNDAVRAELDRDRVSALLGPHGDDDTSGEVLQAFVGVMRRGRTSHA